MCVETLPYVPQVYHIEAASERLQEIERLYTINILKLTMRDKIALHGRYIGMCSAKLFWAYLSSMTLTCLRR
jgi:hypothetical protein